MIRIIEEFNAKIEAGKVVVATAEKGGGMVAGKGVSP